MRDPQSLPRQNLNELYLHTQHPYRCPECKSERVFLAPQDTTIPTCPECNVEFVEDIPGIIPQTLTAGNIVQTVTGSVYFRHTWTAMEALRVIESIPEDSFHWKAISWERVEYYADILRKDKWITTGQYWHPVRFSTEGDLMTGAQRLLAVFATGLPMETWVVDHSGKWFPNNEWCHPPDSQSQFTPEVQI